MQKTIQCSKTIQSDPGKSTV